MALACLFALTPSLTGLTGQANAAIIYVDANATGDNNGTTWEHAYVHPRLVTPVDGGDTDAFVPSANWSFCDWISLFVSFIRTQCFFFTPVDAYCRRIDGGFDRGSVALLFSMACHFRHQ